MSRHHILPPIVYTPPAPKPKETKRRRGVGYAGDVDETEEASAATNTAEKMTPSRCHSLILVGSIARA